MTNNLDDFEQPEPGHEELPPKRGIGSNLANAWRSQPLFKLFVVMVAVGAIVAVGVSFFSSGNARKNATAFVKPPELNEAPGGKASPYMKEQTELANKERTQEALKNGGSALPTPIGQTPGGNGELSANGKNESLNELRAELETMNKQLQMQRPASTPSQPQSIQFQPQREQQQQAQQQQVQQQTEQFDDSLAQAMQRQMSQLMESWTVHGVKDVTVSKPPEEPAAAAAATAAATTAATTAAAQQQQHKIIVPAGTVSYAQLLTEANSDVPGPILAQIVSGPLAGARAVGQFEVSNGWADYLVLQFNLANLKGKDYAINAVALDPDTSLGGMATDVDQRYFLRMVLPAAAGFLQGFGSALGQNSSSTVTNGTTTVVQQSGKGITQGMFTGLGQAGQTASEFFQNQANQVKPLVRVASGTPLGMFFVTSVTDSQGQQTLNGQANGQGNGYQGNGYPQQGQNGGYGQSQAGGYPGSTIAGYGNQGTGQNMSYSNSNVPYPNYAGGGNAGNVNTGLNNMGGSNSTMTPTNLSPNTIYTSH